MPGARARPSDLRAPYYFEVRLDRDYTLKPRILDNIRSHIRQAHGFVADISGTNANVMLELGAVMIPDDDRPIFCLTHTKDDVPADIKDRIHIPYSRPEDSPDEIEAAIRTALAVDGRPKNEGVALLLERRTKRYLSGGLLRTADVVKLTREQINTLCGHFKTVEDLLGKTPEVISAETQLALHIIQAVHGELTKAIKHGF